MWQATGVGADLLGKFQTVAPLVLQILGGLGALTDHVTAAPRKVSLKRLPRNSAAAFFVALALMLGVGVLVNVALVGCQGTVPPATQPSLQQQLQAEQDQLNGFNTAATIAYDGFILVNAANPNPVDAILAQKAYQAVQAAIATAQSHINAGDVASVPNLLADVSAAFQKFVNLQPIQNSRATLHARVLRLHH